MLTYRYHAAYGSDEVETNNLKITAARISEDGLRVTLDVAELRELFVHELIADGVRSKDGDRLLHSSAYYTLNAIPK